MANLVPAPSNRDMWRAYAFAPLVTPLSFIAFVAIVGIVIPIGALAVIAAICYLVAGLIGMPIAFHLRRRNALNARTIHGAAFCWGLLTSIICSFASISVAAAISGTWESVPLIIVYSSAAIILPVVLAGTAFWLLLRRTPAVSRTEQYQSLAI
ncbi:hypothetical protein [Novipirellula rosea]|uniref:Uncharacterized protein n=1 Tax=Novipirellula rosea TaxID=1031540 RepID=A0ABP8MQB0_9BACT